MQQSSSSIGSLAAALAKAQIELINPEKSMIATIRADNGAEQIFRYAPLSSGLEILRKILGQHEIAILQATVIDQAAGVVKLTTTLWSPAPIPRRLKPTVPSGRSDGRRAAACVLSAR